MKELTVAFGVAKTRDDEIKAKKGGDGKADNKKKAKANAAMACLQQMGLVPKDPDNPV